ncbi:MAG: NlpC/P60 family protein [Capsulimonadaceae bacterium]
MAKRRSAARLAAACSLIIVSALPVYSSPTLRRSVFPIARPLPSRGGFDRQAVQNVVGRLAVVTVDNTPIHRQDEYGEYHVLSVCKEGQTIAVSGQTPHEYAVVMIDGSVGLIPKSQVQLLPENVVSPNSSMSLGARLVQTALQYIRVPYQWGGNSYTGIDCSGLVRAVFSQNGIDLPRHSGDQAAVGYDVPLSQVPQWVPGDRMYFACHGCEIDHTGMYIGNGYFIHSSIGNGARVAVNSVYDAYYYRHLVAVRRSQELLDTQAPQPTPSTPAQPNTWATAPPTDRPVGTAVVTDSAPAIAGATRPGSPTLSNVTNSDSTTAVPEDRTVPPATGTSAAGDPESSQE